jgi:hypothetical protein
LRADRLEELQKRTSRLDFNPSVIGDVPPVGGSDSIPSSFGGSDQKRNRLQLEHLPEGIHQEISQLPQVVGEGKLLSEAMQEKDKLGPARKKNTPEKPAIGTIDRLIAQGREDRRQADPDKGVRFEQKRKDAS